METRAFHVLLKPDSFWRGTYGEIIRILLDKQCQIINYNIIAPSDALLNAMYLHSFKWTYDYFHHMKKLFSLGPSLSLVCVCDVEEDELEYFFKSIKGAALPIDPSFRGSIRKQLGVADRSINSVHIADNLERTNSELKLIYGGTGQAIVKVQKNTYTQCELEQQISNLLPVSQYRYSQIEQTVVNRIRDRYRAIYGFENENPLIRKLYSVIKDSKCYYEIKNADMRWRYWDYILGLCVPAQIYVSPIERYIIKSDCLYHNINLSGFVF